MKVENLVKNLPDNLSKEVIQKISEVRDVRIERIVSKGHSSPKDFWYDQTQNELVLVVRGRAKLQIMGESKPTLLSKGDYVIIPPHVKHRVQWTDPGTETVWLAVYF